MARRHRTALLGRLWLLTTWLVSRRRPVVRPEDIRPQVFRTQTRGMGLRMTEWARDRLRPRWLRVRVAEPQPRLVPRPRTEPRS